MTLANLLVGFSIGLPIMIAVGPISVLLLDQGLERGVRSAAPAVLGVASADLTYSALAAVAGSAIAAVLDPIAGWLTLAAVAVLAWLAFALARSAMVELRTARALSVTTVAAAVEETRLAGVGTGGVAANGALIPDGAGATAFDEVAAPPETGAAFGHLAGFRLAVTFFGLTAVNPLSIVLLASVVIAGGRGVGTAGWAIGMALASLVAHGSYVVLGGVLGTQLSPVAVARLRFGAAIFMAGLAVHFLFN